MDWSEQTEQVIEGCGRFLDRLWRTCLSEPLLRTGEQTDEDRSVRRAVHRTVADVTKDLERWSYNTAVAHCMELLNTLQRYARGSEAATWQRQHRPGDGNAAGPGVHADVWNEALNALLSLLAPLSPHVTAELWERRHPGSPRSTCSAGRRPTPS